MVGSSGVQESCPVQCEGTAELEQEPRENMAWGFIKVPKEVENMGLILKASTTLGFFLDYRYIYIYY